VADLEGRRRVHAVDLPGSGRRNACGNGCAQVSLL
jgi:hypothetical protein